MVSSNCALSIIHIRWLINTSLFLIPAEQESTCISTYIIGVSFAGTLVVGTIVGFIIGLITGKLSINTKRRHFSNTSSGNVVAASNVGNPTVLNPVYEEIDLKTHDIESSHNVAYNVSS